MKKVFTLNVLLLISLMCSAEQVKIDGFWYEIDTEAKFAEILTSQDGTVYSGNVVIPENVTHNGVEYPVTIIGEDAFWDCPELTSITIPNSVISIKDYAFGYCYGLTSITIPNSVTSIGSDVFDYCIGLTSITIPSSVTSIGEYLLSGCESLTSVVVDGENKYYDSRENCNAIIETSTNTLVAGCQNTLIPSSVTSIGAGAFYECAGLTSITLPESLTSIGNNAFDWCTNLSSITIPNSVTHIGDYAFYACLSLTNITIPNSVTYIGDYTFYGLEITSITIPNSVTSIGTAAFGACSTLTNITIEKGNGLYDSRENCNAIIETNTNTLIQGCQNTIIPNSVTSIGKEAFEGCTSLTNITIPNSVTSIGGGAFYHCTNLTNITIPNSVTSIEYYTFAQCENLTSVNIPNSVTSIGGGAFSGCTSLTNVTIPNSVTNIDYEAFYRCENLTDVYCFAETLPSTFSDAFAESPIQSATLHVPASALESYKGTEPWSNFGNIVALTEEELAQIHSADMNSVQVKAQNGEITIEGAKDKTPVHIYTMNGTKVASGVTKPNATLTLHTGFASGEVAIVTIGTKSVKVVMK